MVLDSLQVFRSRMVQSQTIREMVARRIRFVGNSVGYRQSVDIGSDRRT